MDEPARIRQRFAAPRDMLDERSRRLMAAAESQVIGRGGMPAVSQATALSRRVVRQRRVAFGARAAAERGLSIKTRP
jgi:hypothetical protein